jgi:hypothetical protein
VRPSTYYSSGGQADSFSLSQLRSGDGAVAAEAPAARPAIDVDATVTVSTQASPRLSPSNSALSLSLTADEEELLHAEGISDWLVAGGGFVHESVEVHRFPGMGLGLRARETIPQAEVLCVVPEHMCIAATAEEGGVDALTTKLALERARVGTGVGSL